MYESSSSDNCECCCLSLEDINADINLDARSKRTLYTIESLELDESKSHSCRRIMSEEEASSQSVPGDLPSNEPNEEEEDYGTADEAQNLSYESFGAIDFDTIRKLNTDTRNEIEMLSRTLSSLFDPSRLLDPESAYSDLLNIQKNIDCLKTSTQANLHHLIFQRQVLRLRAKGQSSESLMRTIDRKIEEVVERDSEIAEQVARKRSEIKKKLESIDVLDEELSSMDKDIRNIQTHYDVVVTELGHKCLMLRNRLLSLEKLSGLLERVSGDGDIQSEIDALLRKRLELLARTDLTEEEKARLLAEIDAEIERLKVKQSDLAAAEQFRQKAGRTLKRRSSIDVVLLEKHFSEQAKKHGERLETFEGNKEKTDNSREKIQLDVKIGFHKTQKTLQLGYLDSLKMACGNLERYEREIDKLEDRKRLVENEDEACKLDGEIDECFKKAAVDDATLDELYEIYKKQVDEDQTLAGISPAESMVQFPKHYRSKSMSVVTIVSHGLSESSTESFISTADTKYLKQTVGGPLTLALAEIVARQPEDPVHYLAHWLIKFRYNQEVTKVKKQELDELTEMRIRIAAETRHRNLEREAYEALLELVYLAKEIADRRAYEKYLSDMAGEEEEGGYYYENNLDYEALDKFETV